MASVTVDWSSRSSMFDVKVLEAHIRSTVKTWLIQVVNRCLKLGSFGFK